MFLLDSVGAPEIAILEIEKTDDQASRYAAAANTRTVAPIAKVNFDRLCKTLL
jgi:hypothetical protein